jgi:type I restriction enzyme S subunit
MVRQATGASYPAVSDAIVKGSKIPLPPLAEQKRIAAILDKAEAIRRKREQAIKLADEFLRSLFLDMFGDPVSNPKGWPQKPLRDCVEMANGSTPPKEVAKYWNGSVPWVSPKDMKFREITGSIDHVSELAVSDQTVRLVPSGTVLIVIRGMILAHTVPIAITSVECTINQDMKALRPNAELDAVFLEAALRTMHNSLLAKVSTSTHGTKKLDSERLRQIFLPIPPRVSQEKFRDMTRIMNKTHSLAHGCREAASSLRDSLVNAAFRYEL